MSIVKVKTIQQSVIGGVTQPLKIGGIASDYSDAKITIDTDGTTKLKGTAQSLETIFDYTVGTASNTIDITGFVISPNALYKFFFDCPNSGDMQDVYLTINGNNTLTNYYSPGANIPRIAYISGSYGTGFWGNADMFIDSVGKFRTLTLQQAGNGTTMSVGAGIGMYSNFNVSSVTSFRITNYRSYNFPVGTKFKLVRIA